MNKIQVFQNENFSVRTIEDNGEIFFVAKDVAQALGYSENSLSQVNNLFGHIPEIWKRHKWIMVRSENGVEQLRDVLCLTEQGLYFFLGRSDKKAALPYQMWIAGEVVPSIHHTGNYSMMTQQEQMFALAETVLKQRDKIQALESKIEVDQSKVDFADSVGFSENSYMWRDIANAQAQNGVDIGQNRAVKWGLENEYLCRRKGHSYLQPTLKAIKQGLLEVDLRTRAVRITPKGIFRLTHDMEDDRQGWLFTEEEF